MSPSYVKIKVTENMKRIILRIGDKFFSSQNFRLIIFSLCCCLNTRVLVCIGGTTVVLVTYNLRSQSELSVYINNVDVESVNPICFLG